MTNEVEKEKKDVGDKHPGLPAYPGASELEKFRNQLDKEQNG